MADAQGAVSARYDYEPYGELESSTGTVSNPIRFAGQYLDGPTGLYKMAFRYYDPAVGLFTQEDPLNLFQDPRQANRYSYAGADPVNNVDPSGAILGIEAPDSVGDALAGCGTGAVGGALTGSIVPGAGTLSGGLTGCAFGVFDATPIQITLDTLKDLYYGPIMDYDCGNRGSGAEGPGYTCR